MAHETGNWMWAEALQLLDRAERMQRGMFRPAPADRAPCWEPPVDVFETETELFVLVALPGVEAARVDVRCQGDVLVVEARRFLPADCERSEVRRLEIPQGRFQRSISLPCAHVTIASQDVRDGLLFVRLRKTP